VFYLPIKFPLHSDGFRNEDTAFQILIDDIIKNEAYKLRKVHTLNAIGIDERLKEALKICKI